MKKIVLFEWLLIVSNNNILASLGANSWPSTSCIVSMPALTSWTFTAALAVALMASLLSIMSPNCINGYALSESDTELGVRERFPIVYVYTVVPAVCKWGLPDYIKKTLEQAIRYHDYLALLCRCLL
jgi:hypothetical protein